MVGSGNKWGITTAGLLLVIAAAFVPGGDLRAQSEPKLIDVSGRLRQACAPDARRLCPEHPLGSAEMRYCMESKHRLISRDCQTVLEDDGHVPRGYFASRRR